MCVILSSSTLHFTWRCNVSLIRLKAKAISRSETHPKEKTRVCRLVRREIFLLSLYFITAMFGEAPTRLSSCLKTSYVLNFMYLIIYGKTLSSVRSDCAIGRCHWSSHASVADTGIIIFDCVHASNNVRVVCAWKCYVTKFSMFEKLTQKLIIKLYARGTHVSPPRVYNNEVKKFYT